MTCYWQNKYIVKKMKDKEEKKIEKDNGIVYRIGIIGTGRIAARFLEEAREVKAAEVTIVYNPKRESAQKFGQQWNVQSTDSLMLFFRLSDIVYVASPHETHYGYIRKALQKDKHVISEKPMVLKKAEAEELCRLAEERNLVLLEGIKTLYCPGYQMVRKLVAGGTIGTLCNVEACFTKLEKRHTRELNDALYGGSFTELGSYGLLPVLQLLGNNPSEIRIDSLFSEKGIDLFTRVSFIYESALADITCGLGVKSEGRLLLSGTEGYILVAAPWWKTQHIEVHYEDASVVDVYEEPYVGDGLRYEIAEIIRRIEEHETKIEETAEIIERASIMEMFLKKRNKE